MPKLLKFLVGLALRSPARHQEFNPHPLVDRVAVNFKLPPD